MDGGKKLRKFGRTICWARRGSRAQCVALFRARSGRRGRGADRKATVAGGKRDECARRRRGPREREIASQLARAANESSFTTGVAPLARSPPRALFSLVLSRLALEGEIAPAGNQDTVPSQTGCYGYVPDSRPGWPRGAVGDGIAARSRRRSATNKLQLFYTRAPALVYTSRILPRRESERSVARATPNRRFITRKNSHPSFLFGPLMTSR